MLFLSNEAYLCYNHIILVRQSLITGRMACLELERKLKEKTAVIGIVGLGYVGLPLLVAFTEAGFKVIGFDIQQKRVDSVNKGRIIYRRRRQ